MIPRNHVSNASVLCLSFLAQGSVGFVPSSRPTQTLYLPTRAGSSHGNTGIFATDLQEVPTDDVAILSNEEIKENPRKVGLALMLDDGTRKSHSVAQNTDFVSGFFKGIGTKSAFATLVTSLYFVYYAMEESFDSTTDARVKALDNSELRRVPSLERDMEYFYGTNWRDMIAPSKAAKEYVDRVQEVAATEPYLLIAHQYTRYLGDLFGGQMMGGMATRSLGLEDGKGTEFYTFDDIPSTDKFITAWYKELNELNLTGEQKEAIVDEANLVFDLNVGILQELEGSPIQAVLMLAINSLKSKLGLS